MSTLNITVIAAGSRGDVQPHLALAVGLRAAGHDVRFLTSTDFETLVADHGVAFCDIGGSMEAVAAEMTELLDSGNFFRILRKMGASAKELSRSAAERGLAACEGSDLIIAGLGGLFVAQALAQKLRVPFVPAFLYPFSPTREFPGVLTPLPSWVRTSWANRLSHRITRQMIWQTTRSADNLARRQVLGMPPERFIGPYRDLGRALTLNGYSPHVIPSPADWPTTQHVTGYWFLDPHLAWSPPAELVRFLDAGPAPVYVGFGSMGSRDPKGTARIVLDALERSGQRAVMYSGWSGLSPDRVPENVLLVGSTPHTWLFPKMAAVVHHGGAGTTAAGLAAGVPSIVTPVMGDQSFWGQRVYELGVGPRPVRRRHLTAERLAEAITEAVTDPAMRGRAATLGEKIRAEDGVGEAVRVIEAYVAQR